MKPPIVINDSLDPEQSGDLCVYDSVEAAESAIEYDSAFDDQLHVYDSEGRKLKIVPNEDRRAAHLEEAEPIPSHGDLLLTILRKCLLRRGEPRNIVEAMDASRLMRTIYERDPNPYSGIKR